MDRIKLLCVTAGGLGLLKPGPGTWGSLPPVALALGLVLCGAGEVLLWAMLALCLLTSQLCLALTPWAQEHFDCKDPGAMVLDEVAGMALTLALLAGVWAAAGLIPAALATWPAAGWLAGAFAAFRLFDITKPGPVDAVQRAPGGILLDDLLAGLFAGILLAVPLWWLAG